jgi:hypothetical protein
MIAGGNSRPALGKGSTGGASTLSPRPSPRLSWRGTGSRRVTNGQPTAPTWRGRKSRRLPTLMLAWCLVKGKHPSNKESTKTLISSSSSSNGGLNFLLGRGLVRPVFDIYLSLSLSPLCRTAFASRATCPHHLFVTTPRPFSPYLSIILLPVCPPPPPQQLIPLSVYRSALLTA